MKVMNLFIYQRLSIHRSCHKNCLNIPDDLWEKSGEEKSGESSGCQKLRTMADATKEIVSNSLVGCLEKNPIVAKDFLKALAKIAIKSFAKSQTIQALVMIETKTIPRENFMRKILQDFIKTKNQKRLILTAPIS